MGDSAGMNRWWKLISHKKAGIYAAIASVFNVISASTLGICHSPSTVASVPRMSGPLGQLQVTLVAAGQGDHFINSAIAPPTMACWPRSSSAMSGLCLLGMMDDLMRWPGPSVTNANFACQQHQVPRQTRTFCIAPQATLSTSSDRQG